jgi:TldD protein
MLASAAMDAAASAGASYADIRIADTPVLSTTLAPGATTPGFGGFGNLHFGIRAIVDGALAFVYGQYPTTALVAASARDAVASARGISKTLSLPTELSPAPVATGEWSVPMVLDPFTVPLQAHADVLAGYIAMARRVKYGDMTSTGISVQWIHETRVFASTEGAMITQHFRRTEFGLGIRATND